MMRRANFNEKVMEIKKGPWTREEDQKLLVYIQEHGHGSWRALPAKAGLQRCGKSCRLRWTNYLSPHIKRGKFSAQEDMTIIRLHALLGNRWSSIATHLPKRTDNEIKNYWNTRLKKRLTRMGIDPATHKPKNNLDGSTQSREIANISHMAQWETARLEAEARLVRESRIVANLQLRRKAIAPPPLPSPKPRCLDVLRVWQANTTANNFFNSLETLESPTSTLNFSSNNATVPTVGDQCISFMENDSIMMNKSSGYGEGKMENSMQLEDINTMANTMDYDYNMLSSMDFMPVDNNCNFDTHTVNNMVGRVTEDFEDSRDYWNELLNLVSTPMASPVF